MGSALPVTFWRSSGRAARVLGGTIALLSVLQGPAGRVGSCGPPSGVRGGPVSGTDEVVRGIRTSGIPGSASARGPARQDGDYDDDWGSCRGAVGPIRGCRPGRGSGACSDGAARGVLRPDLAGPQDARVPAAVPGRPCGALVRLPERAGIAACGGNRPGPGRGRQPRGGCGDRGADAAGERGERAGVRARPGPGVRDPYPRRD
jgi:hypothetical protein